MHKPEKGERYIHFKGMICEIVGIAMHTESEETLVIYKDGSRTYARPLSMFCEKVDKVKYPDVEQVYRFEKVSEGRNEQK